MATARVKRISFLAVCMLITPLFACQSSPSPTPQATETQKAVLSPTPTDITPPLPTFDAGVQPYLENVEEVLRHSAVVQTDRAVGIPDACPNQYLMAFPYTEPDHRGGMTIAVTGLMRNVDDSIIIGEHEFLWGLKGEGVEPERCKDIFIQNRSEPGLIRITFQVQHPDDRSWRIGAASGPCPGIELWLAGYFLLNNPDDFDFLITQFDMDSPIDYWLRDGSQLHRYQWEPWKETLLWSLENVPGELVSVVWSQDSEDYSGDGDPDLLISWKVDSEVINWIYSRDGSGFTLVGELNTED